MNGTTSDKQGSVITFGVESCSFDTIYGFRLGRDRLAFGDGFFAAMTARAPLSWRLRACHGAGGRALLAANTAWTGWQFIADFAGLDSAALAAAIADERLVGRHCASVEEPVREFAAVSRMAMLPRTGAQRP